MLHKTNAARILDQMGITYELQAYEVDPEYLSAEHTAETLGIEADKIFKTLVLEGNPHGYFVCIIPACAQVDFKKAALASQNKNCDMIPTKALLPVTGYIRGGCSPIGMKKHFPTYIEEWSLTEAKIYVSAGKRGLLLQIGPEDLIRACQAQVCDLIIL